MTFVKWYLFKLKVSGYSFLYSVLSLADLINPLWKCQGRNEHKGMIMEYEHQPSGVRQPGQDTDATKRQGCAKWCANQFRRYYLKVQETIRYRCVIPYAGISFNFLVLPIHRYQYYLFQACLSGKGIIRATSFSRVGIAASYVPRFYFMSHVLRHCRSIWKKPIATSWPLVWRWCCTTMMSR